MSVLKNATQKKKIQQQGKKKPEINSKHCVDKRHHFPKQKSFQFNTVCMCE